MAEIKVLTGNIKGKRFPIDRDKVGIGRSSDNVICAEDPAMSSHHCAVFRDGRRYTLKDLNSTNGTYLNGVKITENRLGPKDIFSVGATEFQIDGDDIDTAMAMPMAHTQVISRPTDAARAVAAGGYGFSAKRDNKVVWIIVVVLVAIVLMIVGAWFASRLFRS
jgi:predicted component of type VI protein secretion system